MKQENILSRLTRTLVKKGIKPVAAQKAAIKHLQKSGVLKAGTTTLTKLGEYHNRVPSRLRQDENKPARVPKTPIKY